jgi:peptide/nickel transport system substrate-binding protein
MLPPWLRGIVAFVVTLGVVGCTGPGARTGVPPPGPVYGGGLTYAVAVEPDCLDPHVSPADIVGEIQRNVFDSLVSERADGSFVPWLATSWQISPDGRGYTFRLRDDVTFFDGERFNAQAVRANFEHVVAPETKSQYAAALLGPYEGTTVIDEHTVAVHLRAPYAPFLHAVSTAYLGFYAPKALREHRDELCAGGPNAVGSGPFREVRRVRGEVVELARNRRYHWAPPTAAHSGTAYLDHLTIRFLSEDAVRTGTLVGGQVDVTDGLPAADVQTIRRDASTRILERQSPGVPFTFFLNTARPPLNDKRARQAVAAAIDVDSIVSAVYFGEYTVARGPLSPSTVDYDHGVDARHTYDPALAGHLLDELGYTGRDKQGYRTKGGRRLVVVHPWAFDLARDQRDLVSQAVQEDLRKVGVEVRLQPVDSGTYLKERNAGAYDLIGFSWASPDPDVLARVYRSDRQFTQGGANGSRVRDPELDTLLGQGQGATRAAERMRAYGLAQQRILDQVYALPAYVVPQIYGYSARVHGLTVDASGWTGFYDTWVDRHA